MQKYDKVCKLGWDMAAIERLTVTLPAEMATAVKGVVEAGEFASASEVIREALRDWKVKRELQMHRIAALKLEIDRGMSDVAAGRLTEFDAERIMERGRRILAERSLSD